VRVRGAGGGRVSIAGVVCYRPGDRPHLFYQLRVYRRRKGEAKGFTWSDYRDLIIATHRQLSGEELVKAGIRPETIRLSIGIEHIDDIIDDIDQALAKATVGHID